MIMCAVMATHILNAIRALHKFGDIHATATIKTAPRTNTIANVRSEKVVGTITTINRMRRIVMSVVVVELCVKCHAPIVTI